MCFPGGTWPRAHPKHRQLPGRQREKLPKCQDQEIITEIHKVCAKSMKPKRIEKQ